MNSFKPWLLKNVETRDQSAPNFWDLKHLNSINKFEKSSLAPARVSKSKPTKLFVSELLQKEICGFDRSSLKTTKSEEQEVNENSRVPVRTIKFKIIFSQTHPAQKGPQLNLENQNFWELEISKAPTSADFANLKPIILQLIIESLYPKFGLNRFMRSRDSAMGLF